MELREEHLRLAETVVPGGRGRLLVSAGVRGAPGLAPGVSDLLATVRGLGGRVLDLTASAGAGVYAAAAEAAVTVLEPSAAGLRAARATFVDDPLVTVEAGLAWDAQASSFDAVLLAPPADRGNERVLAEITAAALALAPGGEAFMVGHKDLGAKRYEREAGARFAQVDVLSRSRGWRVTRLSAPLGAAPPLPAPAGGSADPSRGGAAGEVAATTSPMPWSGPWSHFDALGRSWSTLPGAFAAGRLDKGTAALLRALLGLPSEADERAIAGALEVPRDGFASARVLDLGCGVGTLSYAAMRLGALEVLGLDDDLAAVRSARRNVSKQAGRNANVEVLHSDLDLAVAADARFDVVLTNPPFHRGKQVRVALGRAFLEVALERLAPGGWLGLVANNALPYEAELEGSVRWETVAQDATFKVLRAWR